MLEEGKKRQLVENINQYNHLLGNFMSKMDAKSDVSENMEKRGQGNSSNHKQLIVLKVELCKLLKSISFALVVSRR